jgi:hypothetical protein
MSREFWYGVIAAVVLVYLLNAAIARRQTGPAIGVRLPGRSGSCVYCAFTLRQLHGRRNRFTPARSDLPQQLTACSDRGWLKKEKLGRPKGLHGRPDRGDGRVTLYDARLIQDAAMHCSHSAGKAESTPFG